MLVQPVLGHSEFLKFNLCFSSDNFLTLLNELVEVCLINTNLFLFIILAGWEHQYPVLLQLTYVLHQLVALLVELGLIPCDENPLLSLHLRVGPINNGDDKIEHDNKHENNLGDPNNVNEGYSHLSVETVWEGYHHGVVTGEGKFTHRSSPDIDEQQLRVTQFCLFFQVFTDVCLQACIHDCEIKLEKYDGHLKWKKVLNGLDQEGHEKTEFDENIDEMQCLDKRWNDEHDLEEGNVCVLVSFSFDNDDVVQVEEIGNL